MVAITASRVILGHHPSEVRAKKFLLGAYTESLHEVKSICQASKQKKIHYDFVYLLASSSREIKMRSWRKIGLLLR